MMLRFVSQMIAILFLIIIINAVGASDFALDDNARIYGGLIDEVIKKYEAKACISDSRCKAVQRDAAIACMKSAYYKAFKHEFIKQMGEQNIDPKPHKIKYFLNQCFFDVVRSNNSRQSLSVQSYLDW